MRTPSLNVSIFIVLAVVLGALAALVYWFPPDQYRIYPRCMLYATTGLQCPGCGGLRAAHQLLHGHIGAAFRLNPLLVVIAPVIAYAVVASVISHFTGRDWTRPLQHPFWMWLLLGLTVAFAIVRNLPFRFTG